jgi:stringent starvation protein B
MAPMAKLTFKALLDWFLELNARKWYIHVQACQFDVKDYAPYVSPETGMLILNISGAATRGFDTHEDHFSFYSRVKGKEVFLEVPYSAVFLAIDPDTGIPNLFPFYEEHADDIEPPGYSVPTIGDLKDLSELFSKTKGIQPSDIKLKNDKSNVVYLDFGKPADEAKAILGPMFGIGNRVTQEPEGTTPKELTLAERVGLRNWVVIDGGRQKPKASMPFIDEVYRAKQERREQLEKLMPTPEFTERFELRSDGSEGKSVFFPDLDVSKCYFPRKRIERPSWMVVIQGGE